jgi:hypothetical protein
MARSNGGVIGSKNLSTFNKTGGVVSLRDMQQTQSPISVDFAVIGGGSPYVGHSAGGGGFCLLGSTKSWPMNGSYTITVGAAGGATYANIASGGASYYAPKGNTSSGASYSASWDEGNVTTGDGGPGGGPAYSAGSIGNAGYSSGSGGSGGNGNFWPINGTYYGGGGGGGRSAGGEGGGGGGPVGGSPGTNGLGAGNSGGSGVSGAVIISYVAASQKFNGGTVITPTANNRYFHIFTSSGTLTPL